MRCTTIQLVLYYGITQVLMWVCDVTYCMAYAITKVFRKPNLQWNIYTIQQQIMRNRRNTLLRRTDSSCVFTTNTADSWAPSDNIFDDQPQSKALDEKSLDWIDSSPTSMAEEPTHNAVPASTGGIRQERRVRYNGTYPKRYNEKYKELKGDSATIQKVLNKGMTPAGQHIPIMIQECMTYLGFGNASIEDDNHHQQDNSVKKTNDALLFVDCTLGYGGHSTHVLQHLLSSQVHPHRNSFDRRRPYQMICFDRDPIEIVKATERLHHVIREHSTQHDIGDADAVSMNDIVTTVNCNFRDLRTYLQNDPNIGKVTALLADLGLSSMQIDDASRGFTYKQDGPLDMRMTVDDTTKTESAYELLCRWSVNELTTVLQDNSDEVYASIIAQAILGPKSTGIPSTTVELANIVRDTVRPQLLQAKTQSQSNKSSVRNYDSVSVKKQLDSTVARVMQAIRIEVNSELDSLQQLLDDLPYLLAPNGRAVFLTFHSGEDRRVKKAFKLGYKNGIYSSWSRDVVRPTSTERYNNPRSSCCKLRWVVRSQMSV
jgi:16S rRNA (cytosine1402-N4)-methyltransferase